MTCHAGAVRILDRTFNQARLGVEGAAEDTRDEKVLWDDATHIKDLEGYLRF
jgi:hypothetical protein